MRWSAVFFVCMVICMLFGAWMSSERKLVDAQETIKTLEKTYKTIDAEYSSCQHDIAQCEKYYDLCMSLTGLHIEGIRPW